MHSVVQWFAILLVSSAVAAGTLAAAQPPSSSTNQLMIGNATFAIELYQREKGGSQNLFFSPLSISTALAMTYAGARGETAEEMKRALHFDLSNESLHEAFGSLHQRFEQIQKSSQVQLSIANSLWCQQGYPFAASFLDINKRFYHAELRQVSFQKNAEKVRNEINSWVEKKTNDKIRDLLKPGQVDPLTRLLLCNAIYFKGDWATQFDPKATSEQPFFVTPSQTTNVPMMSREWSVRARSYDDFQAFALPYAGDELEMIVLLPKQPDGLAALEGKLEANSVMKWIDELDASPKMDATVALPKFKLNCRLDLARELSDMGMKSAFTRSADFSGMDGQRNLFIGDVVHQACVDVNEQGTEAAAATAVRMRALSVRQPLLLRADHPFVFLIVERQTRAILFLGRVLNPVS